MLKTIREAAGNYTISDGADSVSVVYSEEDGGWLAYAAWNRDIVTDPLETKREAMYYGQRMLINKFEDLDDD